MKVLVGCEFSGVVRRAFAALGHEAWSCDLLPTEDEDPRHLQCNVLDALDADWDLAIFHPPCTHLAVSGARWFKDKANEQAAALAFVEALWAASIPRVALENPVSVISTRSSLGRPTQIIQPYQFGHAETKTTCLWLRNLPKLQPTKIVAPDYMRRPDGSYYTDKKGKRYSRVHFESGYHKEEGNERWRRRSRTYTGIAAAMAAQWGGR